MCSRKFKYFLLFCVLFSSSLFKIIAQPAYVNMYDRIPMKVQLWGSQWNTRDYTKLKEMGTDIVMAEQMDTEDYTSLYSAGINIIPLQTTAAVANYIARYSEGAYTVWEAEGTNPLDGNATLERETSKTFTCIKNGRNAIATYHGVASDTILWGPGYYQQRWYTIDSAKIDYTAKFHLLIDSISYPSNYPPIENNEDVICTLQVTTTELIYNGDQEKWYKGDVFVINSPRIIKVKDFIGFGIWDTLNVDYNLMSVLVPKYSGNGNKSLKKDASSDLPNIIRYIEFKIIWSGLSYVQLFTDKIVLQDERGRDLSVNPLTKDQICKMSQNQYTNWSPNFETTVLGWHTKDEPDWIDHLEPIRFINYLIDSANAGNRQLFITIASNWNGNFGDSNFGSESISKVEEIVKRNKMQGNQLNYYLYDYPWNETDPQYLGGSTNIENMLDSHLAKINILDSVFVLSLQTGLWEAADGLLEKIPTEEQFLYNLNVGLLYGAKAIDVSNYFYKFNLTDDTTNTSALYNYYDNYYTPLWFTIRDIVSLRLKDSFGKTLRNIHQKVQHPNLQLPITQPINSTYNWLTSITYLNGDGLQGADFIDVGFFETYNGSGDVPYFMVVNRWYNTEGQGDMLKISLDKTGTGYTNYNVTNFIENTKQTIVNSGYVTIPHIPGEARLFKVYPVLKDGGSLIVSEATHPNDILLGDLTIENGATLIINGTYNAKANITVKSGGKIIAGQNASINFDSGKKLIVEGIVEVKGTSENNNLTIVAGADQAILVKSGSSFTLNYCTILAPHTGIETETGSQSYVNISNTHITAARTGISLIGGTQENGFFTTPPSVIYKCDITTSLFYGISAANFASILVQENTLINCGMSISNVTSAFIQSNNISTGTNSDQPGIFFNNSNGYIRNNTVKNRANGIHLANSSPDIGGNLIENNYLHGLYIGSGSFPNMVGLIQTNPPTYYPLAGYNTIKNNCSNTESGYGNDGSEVYFSYSDAHLGTERNPGCNQISDDRTSTSSMNTILLLGGNYGNEPHFLDAIYNYWGTTTPTSSRFGIATNFLPYTNSLCAISGSEEEKIVLKTSDGLEVDTIYAAEGVPENITELESVYSEADKLYATGVIADAQPLYEQIVAGIYSAEEKLPAYNKLYAIGNLLGEDEAYFNTLQNTFEAISNNQTDTLIKKVYYQNAIKCDVSKKQYLTAINKFDNIIQQNPNSEEAVYAEIDILTTALNLDTTNSSLGKISNGKYLVKGSPDYLSKINDLISSKFGIPENEKEKIIPTEYSLHQNYPNPFNPSTTIKFDIPKDGLVQLEVFDILGRRIYTMVNEYKTAGSYEHQFDASSLASGVYIYKIQAGEFVSSKKMMLLK